MTKPVFIDITLEANAGSTGKASEALCDALSDVGWDCYVAYGRTNLQSKHKTYQIGTKAGQFLHLLKARLFDADGLGSKLATKRLVKYLRSIQPTVIHLRNIHGYYIHFPTLFNYLAMANIPVLWTLHDAWSFTGHCSHFTEVRCEKWQIGCGTCPQVKEYPKSWWLDQSARNYALKKQYFTQVSTLQLICVSQWLTEKVKQSFFGGKVPINTIVNGVNTEIFKPLNDDAAIKALREKHGIVAKKVILAMARPWSRKKGLYDILQLSGMLAEFYSTAEVQVVMVGIKEGEKRLLPLNAIGIHRTENLSDLCALYNLADVYVNASVEESFGLTTAESLACGTPVIGYNNTGTREILLGLMNPNSAAITVPTGDVYAVANAIKTIITTESVNTNTLRRYIETKYNKSRQITDYMECINSLTSNYSGC